jgi:hypothetical protein
MVLPWQDYLRGIYVSKTHSMIGKVLDGSPTANLDRLAVDLETLERRLT